MVLSIGVRPSYGLAAREFPFSGGEGGIRTPEALSGLPVFETGLINHSSTSPVRKARHPSRFRGVSRFGNLRSAPRAEEELQQAGGLIGEEARLDPAAVIQPGLAGAV